MDISLDIISEPSRPALELEFVRDLNEADAALADAPPALPAQARLTKLSDTHHALARALAGGMTNEEAALAAGYTPSRVSVLKGDPAFEELVAYYRQNLDVVFADLHARMSSFSIDLLEELRKRHEEKPESFSNGVIHDLLKTFADRTGFGPKSTTVNVNLDLADRLDAARRRAENGGGPLLIGAVVPPPVQEKEDA